MTLCRPRPSTTVNNTENDENDLDESTTSVVSKGSDKVASNHKPNNGYDGIIKRTCVWFRTEGIRHRKYH